MNKLPFENPSTADSPAKSPIFAILTCVTSWNHYYRNYVFLTFCEFINCWQRARSTPVCNKGIDSYLGVLDAQRAHFAAQQGLVSLRLAKLANRVRLYAVLGGGGESLPSLSQESKRQEAGEE